MEDRMCSHRSIVLPFAAIVVLAGCEGESATVAGVAAGELSSDLTLAVPIGMPEPPVIRNAFDIEDAPVGGPARSEHLGYGTYPEYETEPVITEESGIFNAKTRANFLPGQLSVIGSHDYIGNKGSVDTKANVSFQGSIIGSNSSHREDGYPILWPPWDMHFIWTEARIYTDRECGLTGWGDSLHQAWWEAVLGGPVYSFTAQHLTTNSERAEQPACPSTPPPPSNTNTGSTSTGGGGEGVCYVWITYDIYTGEIYSQQLMFCTDGG
jgi:hypothetical protein